MLGEVTLGGVSFPFTCPRFTTTVDVIVGCGATLDGDTVIGFDGYGTNIAAVREIVLSARAQDGTVFADGFVVPLTQPVEMNEHDAAPYCQREGTLTLP